MKQSNYSGYRILIVDDDEDFCKLITGSLQKKGVQSRYVTDVAAAKKLFEAEPWHLILLDLYLDDNRGEDLLKEIRKVSRAVPVIVVTGHPSIESAVETARSGIAAYLQKPVKFDALWNEIEAQLNRTRIPEGETVAWLETIGAQIRALRKTKGLTLKDLGDRANVSAAMISKVERGKAATTLPTFYRMVRLMDGDVQVRVVGG